MHVLRAGALYFLLVFGAGFVPGPIRILWIVPRVGTRTAELMEAPIMLVVIAFAARWLVCRPGVPPGKASRLGVGLVALGFLLTAEFTLVRWLRGLTPSAYLAERDPVAGAVYVVLLGVFAIMPLFVARKCP